MDQQDIQNRYNDLLTRVLIKTHQPKRTAHADDLADYDPIHMALHLALEAWTPGLIIGDGADVQAAGANPLTYETLLAFYENSQDSTNVFDSGKDDEERQTLVLSMVGRYIPEQTELGLDPLLVARVVHDALNFSILAYRHGTISAYAAFLRRRLYSTHYQACVGARHLEDLKFPEVWIPAPTDQTELDIPWLIEQFEFDTGLTL